MRRLTNKILIAMGLLLITAGCGGSTESNVAPPVELDAPISGRIDISTPDEAGNVTITGSAGAVPGGSLVMGVNETVAGTVSFLRFLDAIIPSAYAQTSSPDVCSEAGHACALADDDGAFTMQLAASVGDSIAIGVIDPSSGEWLSDILRREVSATETTTACSGEGVSGAVVDIAVVPTDANKSSLLLKQGSEETPNQIVIGAPGGTATVWDIEGCHAHSIAVAADSTGATTVAVTSAADGIVWAGTLTSALNIVDAAGFELASGEPAQIAFGGSIDQAFIALQSGSTVEVVDFSLTGGTVLRTMPLTYNNQPLTGLTGSLALDTQAMDDGSHAAVLLTQGGGHSYLTLFSADGMSELGTFRPGDAGITSLTALADVTLSIFDDQRLQILTAVVIDQGTTGDRIASIRFENGNNIPLTLGDELDTFAISQPQTWPNSLPQSDRLYDVAVSQEIAIAGAAPPTIVATTSNSQLLYVEFLDDIGTEVPEDISSSTVDPVALALDDAVKAIYIADGATDSAILNDAMFSSNRTIGNP